MCPNVSYPRKNQDKLPKLSKTTSEIITGLFYAATIEKELCKSNVIIS